MDSTKKIGAFVTDLGVAMIANSTILGEKVDLKKFAIGDGAGAAYVPQPSMTELKNELWRGNISKCEIRKESQNVIETLLVVPPSVGGFTVRELGIFSNDNKLIAICSIPDIEKIRQENNAAMAMAFKVGIVVSNTDVITFEEKSIPIILTKKELEEHNQSLLAHPSKADKDLKNVAASTIVEKIKAVDGAGSGLDADTVDGKHASEFAPSGFGLGTNCAVIPEGADLNDLPAPYKNASGFFTGGMLQNKPLELAGWIYLIQSGGSTGFQLQIVFSVNGSELVMGNIFIRQCVNGVWKEWKKPDADTIGGKDLTYLLDYPNLTNKPEIPTTLPANGGNADTVDGKHASDFAPSGFGLGTNCTVIPDGTDLNNLSAQYKHATGFFTGGNLLNKPKELKGWIYLLQISGSASYKIQIVFNVNGAVSLMGDIFIRQYTEGAWTEWRKPDASTVGGKSVSVLYSNCSATVPTAYLGDHVQYQVY